ncbi:MAG: lamin tail domain-containing protein [Paludibacteraceae bacterium]|nr:lamin tail domain-containing protein [Paludibacteraceae bacterium]MBP6284059.1 lamin tail domain-containing protein [Paludibacteraceae bacterium]
MKKILTFLLYSITISTLAQVNETFSDGNFSLNPTWTGNAGKFSINAQQQLQLTAPAETDNAYLVTSSRANSNASWSCYVKLTFTPSSSNYARWYVLSDKEDLTGSLNGYYILIGNTSKNICFYRQNGTTSTKIIDAPINRLSSASNEVFINLTRSASGAWTLSTRLANEGEDTIESTANDNTIKTALYTGFVCYYTATRSSGFSFDDIVITGDMYEPPVLPSYKAQFSDIVFNEIMANPTPPFGLPNEEYIELYNNTSERINLQDYTLQGFSRTCTFPLYIIEPYGYVVLCSQNAFSALEMYGNCLALDKFPTLTNAGGLLELRNAENTLLSWLNYSENWHTDSFKKNGGWSLECIDASNLIGDASNWNSSSSYQGGTPNSQNSIATQNSDNSELKTVNIGIESNKSILLHFNKPIHIGAQVNSFAFSPSLDIASIEIPSVLHTSVRIRCNSPLLIGENYTLTIQNIQDINSNLHSLSIPITLPETATYQDIVVNEILFNPTSEGVDYVEIYNRSDKVIDLNSLMLTNRKTNGEVNAYSVMSPKGYLLSPHQYCVLSTNKEGVCGIFECPSDIIFIELKDFPSMPDDQGSVILTTLSAQIIDEYSYSVKMHHALISNPEGVALERLHYDRPTQDASNWHSASFTEGYGTPGYKNSQFSDNIVLKNKIQVAPKSFSPNNDGNEDTVSIFYQMDEAGYMATIRIFDASGNCVKNIYQNRLINTAGSTTWDGTDKVGKPLPIGIYIVLVEAFSEKGTMVKEKHTVVLSAKN